MLYPNTFQIRFFLSINTGVQQVFKLIKYFYALLEWVKYKRHINFPLDYILA